MVLYAKAECSLCSKAREMLRRLQGERRFTLEEVDITMEQSFYEPYKDWIPVVTVDGREAMRGIPNELALRRALGLEV